MTFASRSGSFIRITATTPFSAILLSTSCFSISCLFLYHSSRRDRRHPGRTLLGRIRPGTCPATPCGPHKSGILCLYASPSSRIPRPSRPASSIPDPDALDRLRKHFKESVALADNDVVLEPDINGRMSPPVAWKPLHCSRFQNCSHFLQGRLSLTTASRIRKCFVSADRRRIPHRRSRFASVGVPFLPGQSLHVIADDAHTRAAEPYPTGSQRPSFPVLSRECAGPAVAENVVPFHHAFRLAVPERERTTAFAERIVANRIAAGFDGQRFRVAVASFEQVVFQHRWPLERLYLDEPTRIASRTFSAAAEYRGTDLRRSGHGRHLRHGSRTFPPPFRKLPSCDFRRRNCDRSGCRPLKRQRIPFGCRRFSTHDPRPDS